MGGLGDSFYEYLLKAWLQSGREDQEARQMYDDAIHYVLLHMLKVSPGGLTYISDMKFDRLEHKMDHLACFAGQLYVWYLNYSSCHSIFPSCNNCVFGCQSETCLQYSIIQKIWVNFCFGELWNCIYSWYLTLRQLMSYIYGAPILDISRSHTTTQHSR